MNSSSARLDSAVFQLTPTRTRFDLVIIVNGKKEKIASGLLNPFLSHLKVAQDQIAKGGYSIVLEPEHHSDATWFTKATLERFVRFVNTPEILERVYTIESEISQIEEAIAIQDNNSIGINISNVEENQTKKVESTESTFERTSRKTQQDTNEEEAVVLFKQREANGSIGPEGNSKIQLLKVLETRKSVLQKEQGMAFACAVAAGFDIDYMPALLSFAECFVASRLMDACIKFVALWKRKHESGQWLEIEATKAMPNHSDFSTMNGPGIILSNMATTSHAELDSEKNGKAKSDVFSMEWQQTAGHQDNIHGQFPHHVYPWPVHSPPGTLPVFLPCPVQGIPYYQTYPGNSPFRQPVWPPSEDPRLHVDQNVGHRRHSMDNRHNNTKSETWDVESSKPRFQDEVDMERKGSQTGERWKKASQSGRQKSGMVVIRNINYITQTECYSGNGSYSDSASETDEDKDTQDSVKTSKRRGTSKESLKRLSSSDKEETDVGKDEGGHWQAFQNCLLRDVYEDRHAIDQDQFELGKVDHVRRKKHVAVNDPLDFSEWNMHETQGGSIDMQSISKGLTHMPKSSNDGLLLSRRAGLSGNGRSVDDVQSSELDGRRNGYMRAASDVFTFLKQENQSGNTHPSSDVISVNGQGYSNKNLERKLFHDMNNDSYIVEYRSTQVSDAGNIERNAIDMDPEFSMVHKKEEKFSKYRPNELRLMPERGTEKVSMDYDPALDHEMQAQAGGGSSQDKTSKEVLANTKPGSKMLDKEQKSKLTSNSSNKRKNVGPIRGKTHKLNPLDEARARAEKLRNYKADLQKLKREKEEEEIRRLHALKMERQRRIAARSSTITTKSSVPQPSKKQFPAKLLPSSHKASKFSDSDSEPTKVLPSSQKGSKCCDSEPAKLLPSFQKGSKFSDSEPVSSSSPQRFPIRTASVGSRDSSKASKTSRFNTGSHSVTNKLSRSVPSVLESKQEKGDGVTNAKASMDRIRRLSEPKSSTIRQTTSVKTHGTRTISKSKAADEAKIQKISAIINHDRSKAATLPELKIRTSKASHIVKDRSSVKEKTQKWNGNESSMNSEDTLLKKNEIGIAPNYDGDGKAVIEKTVVMIECEKPYTHDINGHKSEEKAGIPKRQNNNDKVTEKIETMSSYAPVHAPVSSLSMNIVDRANSKNQSQPISTEVKMDNTEKEPSKSSNNGIAEETYHARYARVSSLEDCCARNSEYGKATPTSLEAASVGMETFRACVRNSTLEKILEVPEKPREKESSKGLRRLLKFGRKNHRSTTTAGRNMETDNASIGGSKADKVGTNGSSNEVPTLKNLISRDETPATSATPQKSFRSFSLLLPFRSKNNEKKIMMA